MRTLVQAVANDCCYTYANLVYGTESVGFAIAIWAALSYGLPLLFKDADE